MRLNITVLVGVFSALFASSASAQVINACVNSVTGTVRIVTDPSDCRPPDSSLSWNVQGPAGPMGAPGPMGEPGKALDVGEVVRITLPAVADSETSWLVPLGKALLVDHIFWNDKWLTSGEPMEVTLRHAAFQVGASSQSTIRSTTGVRSFDRPLILPAQTGLEVMPFEGDTLPFPRRVYIYGRLVDAESSLRGVDQ